jgi:hypothetical protein
MLVAFYYYRIRYTQTAAADNENKEGKTELPFHPGGQNVYGSDSQLQGRFIFEISRVGNTTTGT